MIVSFDDEHYYSRVKNKWDYKVTPFSAHFISDHRISDQKVRTLMVRAIVRVRVRVRVMVTVRVWVRVRVRVRLGGVVVRNAVGRKVGNRIIKVLKFLLRVIS